ncbi:hypothetical protein ACFL39_00075 [Gemmatimonadota bacterium]
MQNQMTLTTELGRLSRANDVRILQRICLFMIHFIRYLLDHFESPDEPIDTFIEWWNETGERSAIDAEECRSAADSRNSSTHFRIG